jgi:hypothetical protein
MDTKLGTHEFPAPQTSLGPAATHLIKLSTHDVVVVCQPVNLVCQQHPGSLGLHT